MTTQLEHLPFMTHSYLDNLQFDEYELVASLAKESFYDFLIEFWETISTEDPIWNWHIKFLCDELQDMVELVHGGHPKRHDLIVNVPPGSTKSTIFSVMLTPWVWTWWPEFRSLNASHTDSLALDLGRLSRDVVLSEKYQRCFPDVRLRDDQNTKGYFANTKGGRRLTCTVGGKSPTGFHAHFINVDDPIDPRKAISELEIKAANDYMRETLPSRKVNKEIVPTALIMQRLHQNDPTGNWLGRDKGEVRHVCLPADDTFGIKPASLKRYYKDGLLDPVRLPRSVIEEVQHTSEYAHASQYGQSPIPLGGGMFKTDRLQIDTPPKNLSKKFQIRYWDKAYSDGTGAYTTGVKIGIEKRDGDDHYWILDVVRGQWESYTREQTIQQTAKLDTREVMIWVEQEPAAGKESVQNTIRGLAGFRVKADRRGGKSDGDKVMRAEAFATQVNGGNVSIAIGQWNRDYIEELRHFPFSTYKDQVDASSGAFNKLVKPRLKLGAF